MSMKKTPNWQNLKFRMTNSGSEARRCLTADDSRRRHVSWRRQTSVNAKIAGNGNGWNSRQKNDKLIFHLLRRSWTWLEGIWARYQIPKLGRNLPDREINQNYRRHGEQITLFSPQIYFISKTEKYENNSGTNVLESYKLVARLSLLNGLDMTPLFYHILQTFLDE